VAAEVGLATGMGGGRVGGRRGAHGVAYREYSSISIAVYGQKSISGSLPM